MQKTKTKRNIWKDPSRYGSYIGRPGNARVWADAFGEAMGRPEAEQIVGSDSPWSILGIKPGSTQIEIKKAFRSLVMRWHPDKNIGNERVAATEFKKIRAAYEILKTSVCVDVQ